MKEICTLNAFDTHVADDVLEGVILHALDLTARTDVLLRQPLDDVVFLGCALAPEALDAATQAGAVLFPAVPRVPYQTFRGSLYSSEELYQGFDPERPETYADTLDARLYRHFKDTGGARPTSIVEALARRIHDLSMTEAVEDFIGGGERGTKRRVVAIMGGHSLGRDTLDYAKLTRIARTLTQRSFTMVSGGGPGAMEATHVGAWFAGRPAAELEAALALLAQAPGYRHPDWLRRAFEVRARYPLSEADRAAFASLGIPTWLYGHEPPNPFATHVAKYFANSIREDGLVTIAHYGIIFSPGSAGTVQEIFQDACQNHYDVVGIISPMILLGEAYWSWRKPVWPLLAQAAAGHDYAKLLCLTDDEHVVVQTIEDFAAQLGG